VTDHSDKLKEAMAAINGVLLKYDIAAIVILHEDGFSEFRMRIDPTWSVARMVRKDGMEGIYIRAKKDEDFGGDQAAQVKALTATTNMIAHFRDNLAMQFQNMQTVLEMMGKHFDFEEGPGKFTPHRTQ
jgi:hypothetical protein